EGTNAPPAPHIRCHEAPDDLSGPLRRYDTRPQTMPRVGGNCQHLLFLAVQRKGVKAYFVIPESFVEPFEQCRGLGPQLPSSAGIAQLFEYFRHAQPGVIDIALQLAERFWPPDQGPVGIDHAVSRILPAHVLIADRRAGLILLESVAITVAVL